VVFGLWTSRLASDWQADVTIVLPLMLQTRFSNSSQDPFLDLDSPQRVPRLASCKET